MASLSPGEQPNLARQALGAVVRLATGIYEHHAGVTYAVAPADEHAASGRDPSVARLKGAFVRREVVNDPGVIEEVRSSLGLDNGTLTARRSESTVVDAADRETTTTSELKASAGLDGSVSVSAEANREAVAESNGQVITTGEGIGVQIGTDGAVVSGRTDASVTEGDRALRSQSASGYVGLNEEGVSGGFRGREVVVDDDAGRTTRRRADATYADGRANIAVGQRVAEEGEGVRHVRDARLGLAQDREGTTVDGAYSVDDSTVVQEGGATVLTDRRKHARAKIGPDGHVISMGSSDDQVELRDGQVIRRSKAAGLSSDKERTVVTGSTGEYVAQGDTTRRTDASAFGGFESTPDGPRLTGGFSGSEVIDDPEAGITRTRAASLSYRDGKASGSVSDDTVVQTPDGTEVATRSYLEGAQDGDGGNTFAAGRSTDTKLVTELGETVTTRKAASLTGSNDGFEARGEVGESYASDELKRSERASGHMGVHKGTLYGGFEGASQIERDGTTTNTSARLARDKETGAVTGDVNLARTTEVEGISSTSGFTLSRDAKGTGTMNFNAEDSGEGVGGERFKTNTGASASIDKDNNVVVRLSKGTARAVDLEGGAKHIIGKQAGIALGNKGMAIDGSVVEGISDGEGNASVERIGGRLGFSDKGVVMGADGSRNDVMADGRQRKRSANVSVEGTDIQAGVSEEQKGPDGATRTNTLSATNGRLTASTSRGTSVKNEAGDETFSRRGVGASIDGDGNAAVALTGSTGNSREVVNPETGETETLTNRVDGGIVIGNNSVGGNLGVSTDQGESARVSGVVSKTDTTEVVAGSAGIGFGPVKFDVSGSVVCVFQPPRKQGAAWVVDYVLQKTGGGSLGASNDKGGGAVDLGTTSTVSGSRRFDGPTGQQQAIAFFKARKLPTADVDDAFAMNTGDSSAKTDAAHFGASANMNLGAVSVGAGFKVGESTHVKVVKSGPNEVTVTYTVTDSVGGHGSLTGGVASAKFSTLSEEFGAVTATFPGTDDGVAAYKAFLSSGKVRAPGRVVARRDGRRKSSGLEASLVGAKLSLTGETSETVERTANGDTVEERTGSDAVSLSVPKVSVLGVDVTDGGSYTNSDSLAAKQVNDADAGMEVVGQVEAEDARSTQRALAEKMNLASHEERVDQDAKSSGKWTVESTISPAQRAAFIRAARAGRFNSSALIYKSAAGRLLADACRTGGKDRIDRAFAEFAKSTGARGIALIRQTIAESGGPAQTDFDLTLAGDEFFTGRAGRQAIEARLTKATAGLRRPGDRRGINRDLLDLISHLTRRMAALNDTSRYQDLPPAARRVEKKRTRQWLHRARKLRQKLLAGADTTGVKARDVERSQQRAAEQKRIADNMDQNHEDPSQNDCWETEVDQHEDVEEATGASMMTPDQIALDRALTTLANFKRAADGADAKLTRWMRKYNWMAAVHRGEDYGRNVVSPRRELASKEASAYASADTSAATAKASRGAALKLYAALIQAHGASQADPSNLSQARAAAAIGRKAAPQLSRAATEFKVAYTHLAKIKARNNPRARMWTGYSRRDKEPA